MNTFKRLCTIVLLTVVASYPLFSQSGLWLKSATLRNSAVEALSQKALQENDWQPFTFEGQLYLILQFEQVPSVAERTALGMQGVQLLSYLPDYAYLAKVESWQSVNQIRAKAVVPVLPSFKLSPVLANQLSGRPNATIESSLLPMPGISKEKLRETLEKEGYTIKPGEQSYVVELKEAQLQQLAAHPAVQWLDPAPLPPSPEGTSANAGMRNNWLTQGPGDGYSGSGVVIGIADDGSVSHPDLKNRILFPLSVNWGSHGDMTTGLAAGAGNINPRAVGLAPGAMIHLTTINGYFHITEAVQNYNSLNVTITSTSYGQGCGGFYDSNTQYIDGQLANNSALMHIFSAGNSSTSGCSLTYGQVQGPGNIRYGNITGGYKAGKNVIAVANGTFGSVLVSSSSRGPAEDGRLKPDITAIAQGSLTTDSGNNYRYGSGTSAASPTVAGILANLTEAYRLMFSGADPHSALLKAILLNGARDIGRPGPDYDTGWGLVNGKNSMEMLQAQQYATTSIVHGDQRNHSFQVPAGAKNLKVMIYWPDKAGSPMASTALVNDLDMRVISPFGGVNKPLILSTYPHIDSLTYPAVPGTDRINNVEQVVIANPTPGNYTVQVFGHLVPDGPQEYFVVYHWENTLLELDYPIGHENLVPGEQEYIHWNAIGNNGTFTIQFSNNGGSSWQTVATNVAGHLRELPWAVPNVVSGKCRIRISRGNQQSISPTSFNIIGLPIFHITSAGPQTARLSWEPVNGATMYEVFKLEEKYMISQGSTPNTSMIIPAQLGEGTWYSVRALNSNTIGRRAYGQYYEHYNCDSQVSFLLNLDAAPYQFSWTIKNQSGSTMASGGPYGSNAALEQLDIPVCLPEGCYTLSVNDNGNNGLCCQFGQGGYQLLADNGIVLASGSAFGSSATHNFCLEQTSSPMELSMHNKPQVSCFGSSDGWALADASGGTGNYSYLWSNGATSSQIINLSSGVYSVTVSDQTDQIVAQVTIGEPTPISIDIYSEANPCGEVADGEATASVVGGTPPYSYLWSNGSSDAYISLVEPGYYQLTVTDANGCTAEASTLIQSSSSVEIYLYSNTPSCHNSTDGTVYAYVTGSLGVLTYQWSDGSSGLQLPNVGSGLYSLTVTDERGCAGEATLLLEAPDPLNVVANATQSDNSISLIVSGGTSPYSYLWNDGSQAANRQNLQGGTYSVTITDAEGCTRTASATITGTVNVFCESQGNNSTYNWIEEVSVGGGSLQTGNNGGYVDFSNSPALQQELMAGQSYPVRLEPGFLYNSFNVYWRIFADLNEDGDFDDSNEILLSTSSSGVIEEEITIPSSASFGAKRLRISMGFGSLPDPCEEIAYGEVEDYRFLLVDDTQFCSSGGYSTSQEWIERVQVAGISQTSGNNDGYSDFSNLFFQVERGQIVFFSLIPGYIGTPFPENWSIWIDYNGNGIFNPNNELVAQTLNHVGQLNGSFTIPDDAPLGQVRVRIVMRWDDVTNACDEYAWGETEDYSLIISDPEDLNDDELIFLEGGEIAEPEMDARIWPNPTAGHINLKYELPQDGMVEISIANSIGQILKKTDNYRESGLHLWASDLEELPNGTYYLRLRSEGIDRRLPFVIQR